MSRSVMTIGGLALFLVFNPIKNLEIREWQEVLLLYIGLSVVVMAITRHWHLRLFGMWAVCVAAAHRSEFALQAVIMVICGLGVIALAERHGANRLIKIIAVIQLPVMILQATNVWPWWIVNIPRWINGSPGRYVIHNANRLMMGWTGSSGDLGCILAMAAPFFSGIMLFIVLLALLSTQASSAIVAGILGVCVVKWNRISTKSMITLMVIGISALQIVDPISKALQDNRWVVWWLGFKQWMLEAPFLGSGWGYWRTHPVIILQGNRGFVFEQAHFDLLQAGRELGMIGVILIIWIVLITINQANKKRDRAVIGGLAAMSVCQFGHFLFHLAAAGFVAALIIGEAYHEDRGHWNRGNSLCTEG